METKSRRWENLLTEQRNPATINIDELSTIEALRIINSEDQTVPRAVETVLKEIATAVDIVVDGFQKGGRLLYVGAGTSGRLGVIEAAECPPTFGVDPETVQGIIAGGTAALIKSQDGAEDFQEDGATALQTNGLTPNDVVIGIAASGVTPFVIGALSEARRIGSPTIFFSCNRSVAQKVEADVHILPEVGPEAISGSTRLKAGTATKLVLNMITTTSMIRIGKVYSNLMVDLIPSCDKLQDRAERILSTLTGKTQEESRNTLKAAKNELKTAIVMEKLAVSQKKARDLLTRHNNVVKKTIEKQY